MTRQLVFDAISRERDYQDAVWGTIVENPHKRHEWLMLAFEELEEAFTAWKEDDYGNSQCELLQAAAVLVAALEQYGIVERAGLHSIVKRAGLHRRRHETR